MKSLEKAIETTATVNDQHQLVLDEPLPINGQTRVRVIVLLPDDTGIDEREWLRVGSVNPAFDFLKAPEEDIYTLSHGRPFDDEG